MTNSDLTTRIVALSAILWIGVSLCASHMMAGKPDGADGVPSASQYIDHLATIQGTDAEAKFYLAKLEALRAESTPKSLAALEALLNRRDVWGAQDRTSRLIRDHLRVPASKIWYEIKWREMKEPDRIRAAFYGLQPDSPVWLDWTISRDRVTGLGAAAKPQLLKLLLDPALKYEIQIPWKVNGTSYAAELLRRDFLELTDSETDEVLKSGGEWGQAVLLLHLAQTDPSGRAVATMADWVRNKDAPIARAVINWTRWLANVPSEKTRPLAAAIESRTKKAMKRLQSDPADADAATMVAYAAMAFTHLGPSEHRTRFVKNYKALRSKYDLDAAAEQLRNNPRRLATLVQTIQWADRSVRQINSRPPAKN